MNPETCRCGHRQSSHTPWTTWEGRNPCRPARGKGYCTCTGWDPPAPRPRRPCPVGVAAHDNPRLALCSCVPGQLVIPGVVS